PAMLSATGPAVTPPGRRPPPAAAGGRTPRARCRRGAASARRAAGARPARPAPSRTRARGPGAGSPRPRRSAARRPAGSRPPASARRRRPEGLEGGVDADRDADLLGEAEDAIVVGVARRLLGHHEGRDEDALHAVARRARELALGLGGEAEGEVRDRDQAAARVATEVD